MKKLFSYILLPLFLLGACSEPFLPEEEEDFFYVKRLNARFPVWVKGDLDSDVFLIIVHGGPGSTGTQYFHYGAFDPLQEDYAVVYWEERASGFSQGKGQGGQEHLNAEETSKDLQSVIEVINHKYSPNSVFIMGHSWGGVLTTAFLGNVPERQDLVNGWILVDGGHNWSLGQELSVAWVKDKAQSFIDGNEPSRFDNEHWREVLEWYEDNPLGDWDNSSSMSWIRKHVVYVDEADGYFLPENRDEVNEKTFGENGLGLQNTLGFYGAWAWFTNGNPPIWDSQKEITTDKMHNITVPTLITWGRHDGILPVELAQDAYDRISTHESDKSIIIYEQTAHSPMYEETIKFNQDVASFIEEYK